MRGFIFLCCCLLSSGWILAQPGNQVVVFSENGARFFLWANQQAINTLPDANVKACGLASPKCRIRIVFEDASISPIDTSLLLQWKGQEQVKELTYSLRPGKSNRYTLHFIHWGPLSGPDTLHALPQPEKVVAPVKPRESNLYKISVNKKISFTFQLPASGKCTIALSDTALEDVIAVLSGSPFNKDNFGLYQDFIRHNCFGTAQVKRLALLFPEEMDRLAILKTAYPHLIDPDKAAALSSVLQFPVTKEVYANFLKETAAHTLHCETAMPAAAFDSTLIRFSTVTQEYERFRAVKTFVGSNCITSMQLSRLMHLFTHDREKLEIAKAAYKNTTDKGAIAWVKEEFSFDSTTEEFIHFLSQQ